MARAIVIEVVDQVVVQKARKTLPESAFTIMMQASGAPTRRKATPRRRTGKKQKPTQTPAGSISVLQLWDQQVRGTKRKQYKPEEGTVKRLREGEIITTYTLPQMSKGGEENATEIVPMSQGVEDNEFLLGGTGFHLQVL